MLDQKAINDFKQIYFEEYGVKISNEEAIEMGMNLIEVIKFVINPKTIYYEN